MASEALRAAMNAARAGERPSDALRPYIAELVARMNAGESAAASELRLLLEELRGEEADEKPAPTGWEGNMRDEMGTAEKARKVMYRVARLGGLDADYAQHVADVASENVLELGERYERNQDTQE